MDDREFSSPVCDLDLDSHNGDDTHVLELNPDLCIHCKAMFMASFNPDGSLSNISSYKVDYRVLEETNQGCPICKYWMDRRSPQDLKELRNCNLQAEKLTVVYERYFSEDKKLEIIVRMLKQGKFIFIEWIPIFFIQDLLNTKILGTSTASDYSVGIAIQWMKECTKTHKNCHQRSNFVPTRLVDVGSESMQKIRLVKGKDLPSSTEYLTLSHCWGEKMPFRLLKENLGAMALEIPQFDLPKTFQDSLVVTRSLGHRYIWIDSLCILQDDGDDWQQESKYMGNVYSMSSGNISATASFDSSYGLFRDRDPSLIAPLKIFSTSRGTKQAFYILLIDDIWNWDIEKAPLNRRAWVCQERVLSPWNLHFGSDQLLWECKEFAASETFPHGFPLNVYVETRTKHQLSKALVAPRLLQGHHDRSESAYKAWELLLRKYTAGRLTLESDKLVAISGLAAMWADTLNDKYVAGLWKDDLPRQLLWRVDPRDDHQNRKYTAPSWSWASVDGEISYDLDDRGIFLVEIVEVEIEPRICNNFFGQVISGLLVIKGTIARGEYDRTNTPGIHRGTGVALRTSAIHSPDIYANISVYWDIAGDKRKDLHKDLEFCDVPFYFLPILQYERAFGLLLVQVKGKVGWFRRVAIFTAFNLEKLTMAVEYFGTLAKESGLEYSSNADGKVEFIIRLV